LKLSYKINGQIQVRMYYEKNMVEMTKEKIGEEK
jgi:hypothetical protein